MNMTKREDKNRTSVNGLKLCARCLVLVLAVFLLSADVMFPAVAEATEQTAPCAVTKTLYRCREKTYTSSKEELADPWILYNTTTVETHSGYSDIYIDGFKESGTGGASGYTYSQALSWKTSNSSKYCFHGGPSKVYKYMKRTSPYTYIYVSNDNSVDLSQYSYVRDCWSFTICSRITESPRYHYYQWGEWSAWSETEYIASDTLGVETKESATLYRFRQQQNDAWSEWSDWSYTPVEASADVEVETKAAYNHTYKQSEIAPTCTEQGCTRFTCEVCGDYYSENYVEATGHNLVCGVCVTCGYADETMWSYSISNGNVTITSYQGAGDDGTLIIPSMIEGHPVTQIGQSAFYNQTGLTSVTIPDGVVSIGPSAFSGCKNLQTINIPASVQKINYAAFYNCTSLEEITIPEGITDIMYSTFAGCTGLLRVNLPDSVVRIGESAFDNCKLLTTINIPEGVTTIGRVAFFNCRSLDGISLPSTLTSLGDNAFYDCKSLTSITIPGSLTRVQASTFSACSNLETVVIEDGVQTIEKYAFYAGVKLKSVTLTNSVTYIGSYAFNNCTILSDVYYTGNQAEWDALALEISNAPLTKATLHLDIPCAEGHTYDHDFDGICNVCDEVRQLDNTYKFENYRVVFSDPDTTHKNLRVEVYKLGDKTVADPTDEKALKAIDNAPATHWGAGNINKILIADAGNYVLLLKYNVGTGSAIKVPMTISVSADPKLIIDKNNKLTAIDDNSANINHRVVVYYLGDQAVEDIYDEAALQAIDPDAETVWQKTRINRLTLTKGGNYVLHLCYNVGSSSKITVAQQFTVESIPSLSVNINNKVVVTEENTENRNHRAVVYFLGENTVEDPYDETAVIAAAVTTSKTYWGLREINGIELAQGGNYVIHLYYNVGTSEKRTLALDMAINERPTLYVREDGRLVVDYTDPEINNVRAYIYEIGDAEIADIYDEAALNKITTPTQVWGQSSINKKTLTPGTYVIHLYYSVGTSAKKTVAIQVTI